MEMAWLRQSKAGMVRITGVLEPARMGWRESADGIFPSSEVSDITLGAWNHRGWEYLHLRNQYMLQVRFSTPRASCEPAAQLVAGCSEHWSWVKEVCTCPLINLFCAWVYDVQSSVKHSCLGLKAVPISLHWSLWNCHFLKFSKPKNSFREAMIFLFKKDCIFYPLDTHSIN